MILRPLRKYEHSSEVGSWRFYSREPDLRLRPYLIGISGFEGVVRPRPGHGPGSPSAELVISLDGWSEIRSSGPRGGDVFRSSRAFVSGVRETAKTWRLEPGYSGLVVDLTTLGARRLIGAPMSLLTNREVEADEFLGGAIARLRERLCAEKDWGIRFDVLEQFLASRIESSAPTSPVTYEGWERIVSSRGRLRIEPLRRHLHLSHRKLIELFRDEMGLSPKRLAELVRFDHALTLATSCIDRAWSSIALAAGYYDQAHMINDFRWRMGTTPAEMREKIRPEASMAGRSALGALFRESG